MSWHTQGRAKRCLMRPWQSGLRTMVLLTGLAIAPAAWAGGGGGGGGSRAVSVPGTALLVFLQLGAVGLLLKRRS